MKKKISYGIAALAIGTIITFNIGIAWNDNQENLASLSNIEALAGENAKKDPKEGPSKTERVKCSVTTTTTTTTGNNSSNNSGSNAGGGINVGNGIFGGSLNGGYNNGSSSGTSSSTTTTVTTTKEFWANMRLCERKSGSCTPNDPCK